MRDFDKRLDRVASAMRRRLPMVHKVTEAEAVELADRLDATGGRSFLTEGRDDGVTLDWDDVSDETLGRLADWARWAQRQQRSKG